MLTTEAQLCNVALLRVGERQTIDSLEENTQAARACKSLYQSARDTCLEAFWWTFATKRLTLAESMESRDGWEFAYAMPSDCLVPRYIWTGIRNPTPQQRTPFAVELNATNSGYLVLADSRTSFADSEAPLLVYTARVETVALFPPLFADAVAWKLACDLTLGLAVKPQLLPAMAQGYAIALNKAIASDLRVGEEDVAPESESITIRS